ncbi:hypothetical protein DNTS_014540 [Danionella cerebrum]|uniref:Uncharacterized protein n=1 Tax=Danionella cerebrum TaxID=2873325 RepID=A0A553RLT8_9TELE|nr:hypothetical protein DNTS_014540 [Danionella translucida]
MREEPVLVLMLSSIKAAEHLRVCESECEHQSEMSDSLLFAFLVSVLTLSALSSACYIQNCPRGGKREQPEPIRECMSCGPGLSGRCFGPGICCSKALGCFMRSPDTLVCVQEDQRPGACEPAHTPCGERGRCAAPGLCCDAGNSHKHK